MQFPPELNEYVRGKVESGEFDSQEAFAAEAIRVFREMEERHKTLRSDIEHAIAQSDQGESEPLDMAGIKLKARQAFKAQEG